MVSKTAKKKKKRKQERRQRECEQRTISSGQTNQNKKSNENMEIKIEDLFQLKHKLIFNVKNICHKAEIINYKRTHMRARAHTHTPIN